MRACDVIDEVALSKLQHLSEQHVFDDSALASRAHAKDKDWLLRGQQHFHDVIVADRLIRWDRHILDKSHRRNLLVVVDRHASDVSVQIELGPLVRVKIEEAVKDVYLVIEWVV